MNAGEAQIKAREHAEQAEWTIDALSDVPLQTSDHARVAAARASLAVYYQLVVEFEESRQPEPNPGPPRHVSSHP